MLATASKPAAMCQQGSTKHNASSPTTSNVYVLIAIIALGANKWQLLKVIAGNSAVTSYLCDEEQKLKFN